MHSIDSIATIFKSMFGSEPITVSATGRANIIGEHTDYNKGYVLPFCIDKYIHFAVGLSENGSHTFHAANLDETFTTHCAASQAYKWVGYLTNILDLTGFNRGLNVVFGGDLPVGAGLSSSSALCCGFLRVLNLLGVPIDHSDMLSLSSQAEYGQGVQGGLMDQFAIMFGKKDAALLIDNWDMSYTTVPLSSTAIWYLIDSKVAHHLADTAYNDRRATCQAAVDILKPHYTDRRSHLTRYSDTDLVKMKTLLDIDQYDKASFVVEENQRVKDMVSCLAHSDHQGIGQLLYQSHEGLSNQYQVSCQELDTLVNISRSVDAILGSRMMGGGFGGCTLNYTENGLTPSELDYIKDSYHNEYQIYPSIYPVKAVNGLLCSL